jgi:hypothetical protein
LFPNRPELRKSQRRHVRSRSDAISTAGNGGPEKNLLGIPWRVAFALQDDGWISKRNAIIWSKPNAMPESVTDRLSNRYEHLFLFTRSRRYWFNLDPIRDAVTASACKTATQVRWSRPGSQWVGKKRATRSASGNRGKGNPWVSGIGRDERGRPQSRRRLGRSPPHRSPAPTSPSCPSNSPAAASLAGCKPGGIVLDPFSGSGTTGLAANQLGHRYVGIDLNADYLADSLRTRFRQGSLIVGDQAWGL